MKKTKEITVELVQQISGLYKQVTYFDLGRDDLPVHLQATLVFDVPEKKVEITASIIIEAYHAVYGTRSSQLLSQLIEQLDL